MYEQTFVTNVSINTIDKVKNFANIAQKLDTDIFLIDDNVKIDAKSIMGIFSLNITKPLTMKIDNVHLVSQHSMKELLEFSI